MLKNVRDAVFNAGAGNIGNYDSCGYNSEGMGSFRGNEETNPYVGEKGKIHFEKEIRFETIFPGFLQHRIIQALTETHPYEEVAYDIYPLENKYEKAGMGMIGTLPEEKSGKEFLQQLKNTFKTGVIKHTKLKENPVKKVAVCGGAGFFFATTGNCCQSRFFCFGRFQIPSVFRCRK